MTTGAIPIASIDASDRLRPVDPLKVAAIAAAIEEKGLIQPIVVRPQGDGYKLTAGGHRLSALIEMGWTELEIGKHVVIREEETEDDARQTEIFENLFRGELTALDRALHLAKAKEIYDARRGETRGRKRRDVDFKEKEKIPESGIIFSERFTKEAAKRIGLSEASVQDAVAIARALAPEAIADLRGTMIESNQIELRQLADLSHDDQRAIAASIRSGQAKTVMQAKVAIGLEKPKNDDPQARILAGLEDFWSKAARQTRAQFMATHGLSYERPEAARNDRTAA